VTERELVQQLATKDGCLDAMRALVGGVTTTELRHVQITDEAFDALVEGLSDPNPRVRWWCVPLLDHVPDGRAVAAVARALDDPVPRVRRNAAHALGCVACKPDWDGGLPAHIVARLERLATSDPNAKVRAQALYALTCRAAAG
jgi:HEAT repeat protein